MLRLSSRASLFVTAAAALASASCGGQQLDKPRRSMQAETRERMVGAWRLVALEEPDTDGQYRRAECSGSLMFTANGHMAVQVMYRSADHGGSSSYAQSGYEASFGIYEVDERASSFTFRVEGALVRSLVGRELPRSFELSENRLIITSMDPAERWRVVWER